MQCFFDTDRHRCICAPGTNVNNFRLRKRRASDICTQMRHGCGGFDTDKRGYTQIGHGCYGYTSGKHAGTQDVC